MHFNFVKLPELDFELESETTESGRRYTTPNGEKYPSITTVLSSYNKKAIMEWRQRVGNEEANRVAGHASRRGTKMHTLCEQYILGELDQFKMMKMMPLDKMMFGQMRPMLDQYVDNVYCLEQALYSNRLRLAGRVDLIAEWNGVLSVIDFKTSKKLKTASDVPEYFAQCTAYACMYEELVGTPIHQLVIIMAVENKPPLIFKQKTEDHIQGLVEAIQYYKDANK